MPSFCPLIKDICKEETCEWWVTPGESFDRPHCAFRHVAELTLAISHTLQQIRDDGINQFIEHKGIYSPKK